MSWLLSIWCRLTGKSCSVDLPSSRDLMKDMRKHAVKAERENIAIAQRRGDIIDGVFFPKPNNHRENGHADAD